MVPEIPTARIHRHAFISFKMIGKVTAQLCHNNYSTDTSFCRVRE